MNIDESAYGTLDSFRAHLHLVITAKQYGRLLPDKDRNHSINYSAALADLTDEGLSREWANPVLAILEQIKIAAAVFEAHLNQKKFKHPDEPRVCEMTLEKLDFALVFIHDRVSES
jgi:hypothetical protein